MRRTKRRSALLLSVVACLSAQSHRAAYQQAFQTWRQIEPNLESDAAKPGVTIGPRANRMAALAADYGSERVGFLRSASEDLNQEVVALRGLKARPKSKVAPAAELQQLVSAESQVVGTAMASFANDPDRGIQQLRQTLERERAALTALNDAIANRQRAEAKTAQTYIEVEQARGRAADGLGKLSFDLAQSAAGIEKETPAWGQYYQKLSAGSAEVTSSAPPPATRAALNSLPLTNNPATGTANSLARYVGNWTYPLTAGQFHGTQPESVDLVVHDDGGHVSGTLSARFKTPAGWPGDPVLRFDFDGQWQTTPTQTFALVTSDHTKGSVELIPGPAFNLLEVNFQTELKPNKVRFGNFILLKK